MLILSGDHIYKMDYRKMLQAHEERNADLTLAVMDVPPEETSRFGIVLTEADGRVSGFLEKPKEAPSTLANMGVYVFNANALIERMLAVAPQHHDLDFGKHVIPSMVESHGSTPIRSRATGSTWARSTPTGPPAWSWSPASRNWTYTTRTG